MELVSERGTPQDRHAPEGESAGPMADAVVRTLLAGAGRLAEGTTEEAVCFAALEVAALAVGARGGSIRLLEQDQLRIVHQVSRRPADDLEQALLASRFAPLAVSGPSAAGRVATTQRPLVFEGPEDYRHHGDEVVPDRSTGHAYIPLVIAGRTIGTIGLGFESFRPLPAEVLQALMTFATQAALAVERVRLLRAQEEALTALALSAARTSALQRVTRAFARSSTAEEVFAAALDAVEEALQPDAALAVRVDGGGVRCVDARGEAAPQPDEPLGHPFTVTGPLGMAVRHGSANWFDGGRADGARAGLGRAGGAVPLLVDGGPVGALAVLYAHPRPVPQADRTLLASIAELCTEALRRAGQEERARRVVEQRLVVRGAGRDIARAATIDEVLDCAVRAVGAVTGYGWAVHAAVHDGRGTARLVRAEAGGTDPAAADVPLEAFAPLAALVNGAPPPATAGLAVALSVEEHTVGVLGLEHRAFEQPTPDIAASLQSIALLAADGVNRVRLLEAKQRADAHAVALHRVTRTLSRSVTIGEVLQAALAVLREALDPVRGGAVLADEDGGWPNWQFAVGSDEIIAARRTEALDEPVLSVLRDGRARFYESGDELFAEFGPNGVPERFRRAGIHLPLEVDGVTVGVMGCEFAGPRPICVEERALSLSLASLSAEAVRRARLYEEERRNAGRHAMLRALGEALARTTTSAEGLAVLTTALRSHLGALQVQAVFERGGLLHPPEGAAASGPPCTAVELEGRPPEEAAARVPGDERLRWLASPGGVPLGFDALYRSAGEVFGLLSVRFAEPTLVPPGERAAVADAVSMAREALRRARSLAQQDRAAARAQALHRVTESFSRATTTEEVVAVAVTELHRTLQAVATAAGIVRDGAVVVIEALGEVAWMRSVPPVPVDAYWPVAEALRTGRPVWHEPERPVLHEHPARIDDGEYTMWSSGVVLPIVIDGEAVGALTVGVAEGRQLEPDDRDLLESVVRLCGEALRRARLYDQATAAAERYQDLFGVYERLFRRHPQPMAVLSGDAATFLAANDAHVRMLGYTEGELLQLAPSSLVLGPTPTDLAEQAERIGEPPGHTRVYPLMRFVRKDRSTFIGRLTTCPVDFEGVPARLALLTDETARVDAERDRASLQERVLTAAEEERRRISLDLHDGPVQDLSIAVMRLSALRHAIERGEPAELGKVRAIEESTRLTVDELRGLMQQLYPRTLLEADLVELLEEVIDTGPWSKTVEVTFRHDPCRGVPPASRAAVYRVVIEALTNVYKHARATSATVELREAGDALSLRVIDNGVGLGEGDRDPDRDRGGHLGLVSMRDRIALLGGHCTIEPGEHGGTVVEALLPRVVGDAGNVENRAASAGGSPGR